MFGKLLGGQSEATGADATVKVSTNGEILVKINSFSYLNIATATTTTVKSGLEFYTQSFSIKP